jgi:phage/plasmid-like protein (TIGR03299 family)
MSDFIETFGEQAAFASLREPGWHTLGTVFSKPVNVTELMELSHTADWNVRVVEIEAPDFNFGSRKYFFVVRDNPFVPGQVDVLHVSGKRYTPFQNESLFYIGHDLVEAGLGRWETAGSIKEGAVVFGSLSIDREVVLDPDGANDVIKNYLLLAQSHDGTLSITGANTPVRVVCSNTLNWALAGAKQTFSFRHTQSAEGKAAYITKAITNAHGYIDKFEGLANTLIGKSITDKQWNDILMTAYPKPEDKEEGKGNRALTMWTKKFDVLNDLRTSPTNAMWDNTAWGVLNVLTEDLDWFRTGRGDNKVENLASARSGFDPAVNATRNKFLSIVSEAVGV